MNWIAADLLMFLASVVNYTAVRKASLNGATTQFNNLAMFALPVPVFIAIALANGDDFSLNGLQLLEVAAAAIGCSYLGNAFSMKSIELAPNPGYSLMLSKSYVVLTTVWSVAFFDSPVTLRSPSPLR